MITSEQLRAMGLQSITIVDREDHGVIEAHTITDPRASIVIEDKDVETCWERLVSRQAGMR